MAAVLDHLPHPSRVPARILIADDNEVLRVALRGLLRDQGHSVQVVADGREAIEAAAVGDFDLVFMDVQMPRMGGYEAATLIRRARPGDPPRIIGISAAGEERPTEAASGMDDFLLKPVRIEDLLRVVQEFTPR
jgi:CheY-like chemotaxis protein